MRIKISLIITALFWISIYSTEAQSVKDYNIKFNIEGLQDSAVYLAYYYGKRQYYKDTVEVNENGQFSFQGDSLPGGIYSVIFEDQKSYFEFVLNEPEFTMTSVRSDVINNMKVEGSRENEKFYEYLAFVDTKRKESDPHREFLKELSEKEKNEEKISKAEEKKRTETKAIMKTIDDEVRAYKLKFIDENPDIFMAKVFKASADPELPDFSHITDEKERKKQEYLYFRANYLNDIDFSDQRMLFTPVLYNKMNYYITKLTVQHPDSVIAAADLLVAKARPSKEMFKFVVHTITKKYEDSQLMGMDGVVIHMLLNYYCTGDAFWMNQEKLEDETCPTALVREKLLIGKKAPNVILPDTSGKNWVNLHEVDAKVTVLVFWDSGCGHCKKMMPKLREFYNEYKSKGVEVFAVGTEYENEDWIKYIKKSKYEWINVSDVPEISKNAGQYLHLTTIESLKFRDVYDIFSTPKIFLLDENKMIIGKKLDPEQMGGFVDNWLKQQEEKANNAKP